MFSNNTDRNNESSNCSKQNIKASLGYFSKFSKRSRRQRRNETKPDEEGEGGFKAENRRQDDNENDKNVNSAQFNTSSASSSGYISGFKPIQHMTAATTTTSRPYTSQQHFYHFGGATNSTHDNTSQLISDNSNGNDVDDISTLRLPSQMRQFSDHQHSQQQQQLHARYSQHSNFNSNRLQGGHNQVRAPMMVPMMIEDNDHLAGGSDDDDNIADVVRHESDSNESNTIGAAVVGADGELDVDGVDLIDDDIGENLNGRLDGNSGGNNNNYNSSTCYSANRLRSLYAARLNQSRDCALDSSMSVVDHRNNNNHHHHQDRYFIQQQQQQQLQYLIPTPVRPQCLQKQCFNGATKSFAPSHNTTTGNYNNKYHDTNECPDLSLNHTATAHHQPISAIYHQPNSIPNYQLQQQYHSFSYLQPQSQHQLHQLQQQYPSSLIHRTLTSAASNNRLAGSTIHLIPTSSSQLESSSAAGGSSNSSGSTTTTGAPIDSRLALQPTSKRRKSSSLSKNNAKMQNSRQQQQHHASDTSHHHHHHQQQKEQQQPNSKRKLQNVGSRRKTYHNAINSNNIAIDRQVSEKPGLNCCAKMAKLLLFITNVTFWVSK